MQLKNIPDEMKIHRNFVNWGYSDNKPKMPIDPITNNPAKANDPATWGDFATAQRNVAAGHSKGVGFEFGSQDNKSGYVGIDIDHCIDNGVLSPEAQDIVSICNSYTEVSPSGKGLHIIMRGQLPKGSRNRCGNIEIYDSGRYFTLTGNILKPMPDAITDDPNAIEEVCRKYIINSTEDEGNYFQEHSQLCSATKTHSADEAIIQLLRSSSQYPNFPTLYDSGDCSICNNDESVADFMLMIILAKATGNNEEQMRRIFSTSALGRRNKWLNRKDYQDSTIENAIKTAESDKQDQTEDDEIVLDTSTKFVDYWIKNTSLCRIDDDSRFILRSGKTLEDIQRALHLEYETYATTNNISRNRRISKGNLDYALEEMVHATRLRQKQLLCERIAYTGNINNYQEVNEYLEAITGHSATLEDRASVCQFIWQVKRKLNGFSVKDHMMLVLRGKSGVGKSVAVNQYFSPIGHDYIKEISGRALDDERNYPSFTDNYIGFIDEMDKMDKAAVESVKRSITAHTLGTRPLYGKKIQSFPQNMTFIGTTNGNIRDIIRDPESNRRFWQILANPDGIKWEAINKIDYLKMWQSVDESSGEGHYTGGILNTIKQTQAVEKYKDSVELFIEECCSLITNEYTKVSELYCEYRAFCNNSGNKALTKQNFRNNVLDRYPQVGVENFEHIDDMTSKRSQAQRFTGLEIVKHTIIIRY